jgi:hypothetical protein
MAYVHIFGIILITIKKVKILLIDHVLGIYYGIQLVLK